MTRYAQDLSRVSTLTLALVLITACARPGSIQPDELKGFTTDGCSRFPEGTSEDRVLWCHCCVRHDQAYWMGGERELRRAADVELAKCVESVGKPKTAKLMLVGVRAGGSPLWPTRFRWGYGWPYYRGYKPLSEAEQQRVNSLSDSFGSQLAAICGDSAMQYSD